ncbi:Uncharacterized protein SCG7109_BK_00020 [Chlamydiales bacterium SCGC AG-110-M15]|nr:Uncharacterized protein SCG7109_BK_00020 [Chlamydiales bacterium SCGC AG-110-M15]
MTFFANIGLEAAVVAVICSIFLGLFIVAGIREIVKKKED